MAQVIEITASTAPTPTAKLFAVGSDTVAYTASSVTEAANRNLYSCSFTGVVSATYLLVLYTAGVKFASRYVTVDAANGTWTENLSIGTVTVAGFSAGSITDASFSQTSAAFKGLVMFGGGKSTFDSSTNVGTYYAADGTTVVFTDLRSAASNVTTRTLT